MALLSLGIFWCSSGVQFKKIIFPEKKVAQVY